MKHTLKRHWIKIILVVIILILIIFLLQDKDNATETHFWGTNLSLASQVTCTYSQLENVIYQDNKITTKISEPEKNPMIFTFSQFKNTQQAQLSYLDATQTITNVPIVKIIDNTEKMVFIDGGDRNYLSTHTIYKKEGVAVYTKSVDMIGIPYGALGMGTCVGF